MIAESLFTSVSVDLQACVDRLFERLDQNEHDARCEVIRLAKLIASEVDDEESLPTETRW